MDDKDQKENIRDSLVRAYEVLKFDPRQIEEALQDFNFIFLTALVAETTDGLSQEEVGELEGCFSPAEADKPARFKTIVEKHYSKDEFKAKTALVARKTLKDYIDHLKGMGDESQKKEIGRILAGL